MKISTILILLFFTCSVYPQITEYEYSCGMEKNLIIWNKTCQDSMIYLETTQNNEVHRYTITPDYNTCEWIYINESEGTDIKVTLNEGTYLIKGKVNGSDYYRSIRSNGLPWFQNIGFNIGYSINGKSTKRYECIRPDNLKLYEMQVDAKEITQRGDNKEQRLYVHLTGILARFFGCNYFIDYSTRQFIRYKGVHGPPGTPETIIKIKE